MWRNDEAGNALPVSSDENGTVQASRRAEYGTQDGGRDRADSAGQDKARALFSGGNCGAQTISRRIQELP
jgi:hypothetical protein